MFAFLIALHLLIAASLVIVVLLQSGKGGGLAGAFGGGGGSQTIFGGRGAATFLSRSTAVLGAAFMISSMGLAVFATRAPVRREKSIINSVIRKERTEQPGQTQTQPGQLPRGRFPVGQTPTGQLPSGGPMQPTTPAGTGQNVTPGTGQVAPGAGVVPRQTPPAAGTPQQVEQKKPPGAVPTEKKSTTGTQGQTQEKKNPSAP